MNNRHLYKAKRLDNGEWVGGYLYRISEQLNPFIMLKNRHAESHEVDPFTLCQCIGLTDKNDKLIWENDIVEAAGGVRGRVCFGKHGDLKLDYGFYIKWDGTQPYWRNDICYWKNKMRVIGNSFDNPELLEVGE